MDKAIQEERNTGILLVIVLYKIKLEQSLTYLSLIKSKNLAADTDLLVYDNSPDATEPRLSDAPAVKITYIADRNNSGVSRAYNTAARYALQQKKKWMLLLDQDTLFPDNALSLYYDAFEKYPDEKLFAPIMVAGNGKIISPCYFRFMRGFSSRSAEVGINSLSTFSVINCAMCVDVEAFEKNNGYNELIRLDFSDHDFIRRFKKSNGDRFVVVDFRVSHQLSTETRTSTGSDIVRFDYYLDGAKNMSATTTEKLLLVINAFLRASKLSIIHRNAAFLGKWFKWVWPNG
ncbi:MAG: glycosyltransferase [Bacteroidetes bacterium]|nr:glycosyltransferase [Bacteroidota bacterium]